MGLLKLLPPAPALLEPLDYALFQRHALCQKIVAVDAPHSEVMAGVEQMSLHADETPLSFAEGDRRDVLLTHLPVPLPQVEQEIIHLHEIRLLLASCKHQFNTPGPHLRFVDDVSLGVLTCSPLPERVVDRRHGHVDGESADVKEHERLVQHAKVCDGVLGPSLVLVVKELFALIQSIPEEGVPDAARIPDVGEQGAQISPPRGPVWALVHTWRSED